MGDLNIILCLWFSPQKRKENKKINKSCFPESSRTLPGGTRFCFCSFEPLVGNNQPRASLSLPRVPGLLSVWHILATFPLNASGLFRLIPTHRARSFAAYALPTLCWKWWDEAVLWARAAIVLFNLKGLKYLLPALNGRWQLCLHPCYSLTCYLSPQREHPWFILIWEPKSLRSQTLFSSNYLCPALY